MAHVMRDRGTLKVDRLGSKNRLPIHASGCYLGVLMVLMGIDFPPDLQSCGLAGFSAWQDLDLINRPLLASQFEVVAPRESTGT